MAFNTKIDLYDGKVIQCTNQTLTLSGKTVIATSGDLRYQTHPTFTGATQVVDKCYVDTATGGICANNGLTKRGSFITLGGALTGDTTIGSSTCILKINVNTLSLSGNTAFNLSTGNGVITDTGNKGGLQYATCYDACVVKLSIPNAGWVTGKTSTSGIQTAGNGLTKTLTNVTLGGTISGATVITDSRGVGLTLGVQYGGDYSGGYNARSLVDKGYVSSYVTGGTTVLTANNGLCKKGTNVVLGGALTGNTTIGSGSCVLGVNVNKVNITGVTVNLGGCVTLKTAPASYVGNILTYNASTGEVSQTTLSSLGGLTGATNGLNISGQLVHLGGALCTTTCIYGNEVLCLGTSGNRLANLQLWSYDYTCMNSHCLYMSSSGATFTDLCTIPHGIQYGGDYSTSFCGNSLVSKIYVDSVATGLHVKAAVCAATTVPITLSGNQTIDGFATSTGNRILVKNQADTTTNGIYSANTGSWGRTSDYNGTTGEVSNGDLIPVTSGNTQNSSIWALVTPDPIMVGVTSLNFTEFSTVVDIQQGAGIAINQVGGVHTVCVNLGSTSGLNTSSGLVVDTSIAGCGLSMTSGVIKINAACSSAAAVPVQINSGCCPVVLCSDITSMSAIVTGATNGLTKSGQNILLGGSLCCSTKIDLCGHNFNICGVAGSDFIFLNDSSPSACFGTSCISTTILRNNLYSLTLSSTPYATFKDNNCIGLCYDGDYEANFVPRSLITKQYVHSYVTGGTTVLTANNGLTKQANNNVVLGGALTGTTTINGAQNLRINVTTLDLSGNTSLNLTGTAITLQTTPPVGSTSDAVLVWNSTDKNIKTVSGAALGDKNNVYSHSAVTTSVLLTTGSSYVILVNNSAPVTITLPATPLNGQVFKIKNVSGTAVTNIITVAGNTHNIDGSASGLINTDYGALELMYDITLTAWYTLAFIN